MSVPKPSYIVDPDSGSIDGFAPVVEITTKDDSICKVTVNGEPLPPEYYPTKIEFDGIAEASGTISLALAFSRVVIKEAE